MLYIIILAGVLFTGLLILRKLQRGPYIAGGLMDAPAPVRKAAKRAGLHAKPNTEIIASIASSEICIAALGQAFAQMDNAGAVQDTALQTALKKHLKLDASAAQDLTVLAPWIVAQGGGPTPAFDALTRRLKRLDHGTAFDKLMRVLGDISAAGQRGMPSARQSDAMGALARVFRTA
ncbi:hypothetical protein ABMC89_05850 [Sulfitobacter sp. HNIBRBA3233]|uniref:hypothetical protein n=1 Tax=Sulfitobacter marinivivus TaxID=3158558 RepID=UPI0032DEC0B4